jgi:hypothetical protein
MAAQSVDQTVACLVARWVVRKADHWAGRSGRMWAGSWAVLKAARRAALWAFLRAVPWADPTAGKKVVWSEHKSVETMAPHLVER